MQREREHRGGPRKHARPRWRGQFALPGPLRSPVARSRACAHELSECLHPLSGDTRTGLGGSALPRRALLGVAARTHGRDANFFKSGWTAVMVLKVICSSGERTADSMISNLTRTNVRIKTSTQTGTKVAHFHSIGLDKVQAL
jgi:hypothetical protein